MAAPFLIATSRIKPWVKSQLFLLKNIALFNHACVRIRLTCSTQRTLTFYHGNKYKSFPPKRFLSNLQNTRENEQKEKESNGREKEIVHLMEFPEVVWPSFFKSAKNYILSRLVVQLHFDPEFDLDEFMGGTRQAVARVSHLLSEGNLDGLKGLVTDEAISEIKPNLSKMNLKQRQHLAINLDDIYFGFVHVVGIMFDEDTTPQKRLVEITCCFHCLPGFADIKLNDPNLGNMYEQRHKIIICNYRFIKEFTKGVQDSWTINKLNHFKPTELN